MSVLLGFLEALEGGAEVAQLRALLDDVRAREGPDAVVACVEAWMAHVGDRATPIGGGDDLRSLLLAALDEAARRGESTGRLRAAERAVALAHSEQQTTRDDDVQRADCRLLMVSSVDDQMLRTAVSTLGGHSTAMAVLEAQLKTERVKKDALEATGHRRALARVAELSGDIERAFFESLKILRKLPEEPLFVDEAFRLALLASRQAELVLVFRELALDVALSPSHRATICNKIAHMLERGLDDARGALTAYVASLALQPTSKGARRHAERLARDLGIAVDLDAPPAPGAEQLSSVGLAPFIERPLPDDVAVAAPTASSSSENTRGVPAVEESAVEESAVEVSAVEVSAVEVSAVEVSAVEVSAVEETVVSPDHFAEFSGLESMSPGTATVAERGRPAKDTSGDPVLPPPLPPEFDDDRALDDDAFHDATTPLGGPPSVTASAPSDSASEAEHLSLSSVVQDISADGLETVSAILIDDESIVDEDAILEEGEESIAHASGHVPPPLPDDDEDSIRHAASPAAEVTLVTPAPPRLAPTREAGAALEALARADARRSLSPENKPTRVAAASVVEKHRRAAIPTSLGDENNALLAEDKPAFLEPHDHTLAAPVDADPFVTDEGAPVISGTSDASTSFSGESPADSKARAKKSRGRRRSKRRQAEVFEAADRQKHPESEHEPALEQPVHTFTDDRLAASMPDVVGEATDRAPAPAPLSAVEEATRALLDGDHARLVALAEREDIDAPTRLRLLAAAIVLRPTKDGDDGSAIAMFSLLVQSHEDARRAITDVLLDTREAVLSDHRENMPRLFSHAAHLAKLCESTLSVDDLERVLAPLALLERGPGPLFTTIDDALAQKELLDRRIALVERAIRQCSDVEARIALLVHEIDVLEVHERPARALPIWSRLVLEDAPHDLAFRARARAAFSRTADDEEHVLFLSRLLTLVRADDEKATLLRTMLMLRRRMHDEPGITACLIALVACAPDDTEAIDALLERLPKSDDSRIDLMSRRLSLARAGHADERSLRLTRTLAAHFSESGRTREALRTLLDQLPCGVVDDAFLDEVSACALENGAADLVLPALEGLAGHPRVTPPLAARALRLASRLALDPLRRRARALELIDRALEVDPTNVDALLSKTDLAIEVGDAQGALVPLERLAAATTDPKARARLHVRVGRLLEEHLLRLDEALRRYRAAAEDDPTLREAWEHLRILARQRDDRDSLVFALLGLVGLSPDRDERVALRREIARIERDERVDLARAETAFADLLALSPTDDEALDALLDLVVARVIGDANPEVALRTPSHALVEAIRVPLVPVRAAFEGDPDLALPTRVLRLVAALFLTDGERHAARQAFERVLDDVATDRFALDGLATLLEHAESEDDRTRRREVLESLLLQHAPHLGRTTAMKHWAALAVLRRQGGEIALAKKAARQAAELADDETLREIPGETLEHLVALLDDIDDATVRLFVRVVRARAERLPASARMPLLVGAAERVLARLDDVLLARKLALEAADAAPRAREPRALLLKIDLTRGSVDDVIASLESLADREDDPSRRADLLVELAERLTSEKRDHAGAISALARAISACPTHEAALTRAEALFIEEKDAHGLVDLLTTRLRLVDATDAKSRLALLERIAQLRRYELRDLAGAVEALEAMTAIDPSLQKPREDCARLYTDLGNWRAAANAWRGVLERDALSIEAWRGLFSLFVRTEQADEALAVAQTMVAIDVADAELSRTVRALRPPFPRWPRAPESLEHFRRRVAHDLERTAIHAMLEPIGRRIHPMFARPLKDFGVRRRDRLPEKSLPPSVLLAMRTVADLLGLEGLPDLYGKDLSADDGMTVPPFALLPADEPGLVVSKEVLEGGMTPERAFALGRAAQWLTPHGLLAGALGPAELKGVLEALVLLLAPQSPLEGDRAEMTQLARSLDREVFRGITSKDADLLKSHLAAAARDYAHAREQLHVTDWSTGVGYTGDRIGFLLAGDLGPAVRLIKASGGRRQALGARLAIKELVLFSVSPNYLALRRELGLALPLEVARPILDI